MYRGGNIKKADLFINSTSYNGGCDDQYCSSLHLRELLQPCHPTFNGHCTRARNKIFKSVWAKREGKTECSRITSTSTGPAIFQVLPSLCVACALKEYFKRTGSLRKGSRLFIIYIQPHEAVGRDTNSSLVGTVMTQAGVNVTIFKPHSTRAASTSKAA